MENNTDNRQQVMVLGKKAVVAMDKTSGTMEEVAVPAKWVSEAANKLPFFFLFLVLSYTL